MRYAWTGWPRAIEANIDLYSVTMMCELLSVSRSGLHAARRRLPSARAVEEAGIVSQIRRTQTQHRGRYGRRCMTPEIMESLGRPVNPKRIGRIMRMYELGSRKRRRFRVVTTDSKHVHSVAPNVLERDFIATAPNQVWLGEGLAYGVA